MADTSAIDAIAANLNKAKPVTPAAPAPETAPQSSASSFTNPFSATGVLDFFGKVGELGGQLGARAIRGVESQFNPAQQPGETSQQFVERLSNPAIGAIGEEVNVGKKALDFLKKETNPDSIKGFLSKMGIGDEEATAKAEQLATAKSGKQVRTVLGDTLDKIRASKTDIDSAIEELRSKPSAGLQSAVDDIAKGNTEPVVPERPPVAEPPINLPPVAADAADSAVNKLVNAIRAAVPVREEVAAEQTAERARRASEVAPLFQQGGGEEAFNSALGKLKGELTPRSGKFAPVRNELGADEIKSLFNKVQTSPQLDTFEKVSTQAGLRDLLEGHVPQPKQLENLETVFGHDIIKAIQSQTSKGRRIYNIVVDALNLPRTLITSLDMSAVLRQGLVLSVAHPKTAAKAIGETFRQVFSEANFTKWLDDVKNLPEYAMMKKAGLYISDPRDLAGGLTTREESFISRLAEKIPGLRASQRAYLGYLNKLRVDTFLDLSKTFAEQGATSSKDMKSLADFINVSTGRGSLGRLGRIAPELNSVFFSPRLIAARLSMLNPLWYARQTPAVRQEAIKTMAKFIGAGVTVLSLASLAGADVETDPRSTDFGKIKVGNTRWDIWGGFQQWARVFAQLLTGQKKNSDTGEIQDLTAKKYPFTTRFDVAQDFILGKLAPIPSLALELLKGQQTFGGDLGASDTAIQNTLPLYLQDLKAAYDSQGIQALGTVGVPSFFGVGIQTYAPTEKKGGPIKVKLPGATKASPVKTHSIKIK